MTISQELFELADTIASAVRRANDKTLVSRLRALWEACNVAKRAWSGSNIGYHATVYFEGVTPKPPGIQFSPEWGLLERFGANSPDPGWQEMDPQDVQERILLRARIADLPALKRTIAQLRTDLSDMKEQAVSMLNVALNERADSFVSRQLQQVEGLKVADPDTIAPTLIRAGQWSRDSEAISQGTRVAPHQSLIAVCLSERVTKNGLETLEKAVRNAAIHVQRIAKMKSKDNSTGTNVVIGHGHSLLWRELKDFIKERLYVGARTLSLRAWAKRPLRLSRCQQRDREPVQFIRCAFPGPGWSGSSGRE